MADENPEAGDIFPWDDVEASRANVALQNDWRHYVALAFVSWGEQRLRAVHRVSKLCPGLALAHWLTATVFIARQAFDAALAELRAGAAAQDAQRKPSGRFAIVGLHLLLAQLLAALGHVDEALEELEGERAAADERHIYGRECLANVWYSIGATRLRRGSRNEAEAAFRQALEFGSRHGLAVAALNALAGALPGDGERPRAIGAPSMDLALGQAAAAAIEGRHDEAARICGEALAAAPPGDAGWLIPIDPLLKPGFGAPEWAPILVMLRDRAT